MVAVARTGSFSQTADPCHLAQPSLSQQVQKLEQVLGMRFFDRMKRSMKLTPHGTLFLPRATAILTPVSAGLGVALVPEMAAHTGPGSRLEFRRFEAVRQGASRAKASDPP